MGDVNQKLSVAANGMPAPDALREAAKWFDLYDNKIIPLVNDIIQAVPELDADLKAEWEKYAHDPNDEVQTDLRRWADELEATP